LNTILGCAASYIFIFFRTIKDFFLPFADAFLVYSTLLLLDEFLAGDVTFIILKTFLVFGSIVATFVIQWTHKLLSETVLYGQFSSR